MNIKGINHITFSVSNLKKSIEFYKKVFGANLLAKSDKLAYFDLNGLWLTLNKEKNIPRNEIYKSYSHTSFSIEEKEYKEILDNLENLSIDIKEGRPRDQGEGLSIYFRDPDGHLFEFHTKNRSDRIKYYKNNRKDIEIFD